MINCVISELSDGERERIGRRPVYNNVPTRRAPPRDKGKTVDFRGWTIPNTHYQPTPPRSRYTRTLGLRQKLGIKQK